MDNRKNDDSFDWESINITDFLKLTNPVLRNGFDAIALAIHFVMKKSGFRCIACGDQNETGKKQRNSLIILTNNFFSF